MFSWDCCRTCLSNDNLYPITSLIQQQDYLEMVYNVTGVKITPNDQLPKQICIECTNFIDTSSKFREKCLKIQKELYNRLKNFALKFEKDSNNEQKNSNYNEINIQEVKEEDIIHNNDILKAGVVENIHIYDETSYYLSDNSNLTLSPNQNFVHTKLTEPKTIDYNTKEILIETKKNKLKLIQRKPSKIPKKETKTLKRQPKNDILMKKNKNLIEISNGLVDFEKTSDKSIREEVRCEVCNKILKSKSCIVNHMRVHTYKIVCEHCGKKFNSKRRLIMHYKARHGYEKTDKCSFCDYRGCDKEQVKVHERIHTGERPFVCKECNAGFIRTSSYLQHAATHLPDSCKTVQCKQCPAKFKSVTLMKIHANRHRVEHLFSYKCYVCDKSFARKPNVLRHLRRVHSVLEPTQNIEKVNKI